VLTLLTSFFKPLLVL